MLNQRQIKKIDPLLAEEIRQDLLSIKRDYKKVEDRLAKYKEEDVPYFIKVNMKEIKQRVKRAEKRQELYNEAVSH